MKNSNHGDGEFQSAKLSFELENSLFDNTEFEPAIYYWDSEAQSLMELDNQNLDGNIISATLEHFSDYVVLNKNLYEAGVFEYEIEEPVEETLRNKKFDIVLTLDESGSISSDDFFLMKMSCIGLINKLAEDDRVGIVTFDSVVRILLGLSDKDIAKLKIENLEQHRGITTLYDAIDKSSELFGSESDSSKIIILLTDGEDNNSSLSPEETIDSVKMRNAILYTIGVGSEEDVDVEILEQLANDTGGKYYPISDFSELSEAFETVISDADLYKDSDEDGISDYHEKCLANGKLKSGTGAVVPNLSTISYLNADSDGDGLNDGEEVEIRERDINGKKVTYCYLHSNPCMVNSDGDGLDDMVEQYAGLEPLVNNEASTSQGKTSGSEFKTNKFWEWKEMASKHSWNYIHNAVEKDIWLKNEGLQLEVPLKSELEKIIARIDILHKDKEEIWDVKPMSYRFDPKRQSGIEQLEGYIELAKEEQNGNMNLKRGGAHIQDSEFSIGDYKVEYENLCNGLVIYYFEKEEQKEKVPVTVPEEQTEEKPITESEWYEWLWVCAKEVGYDIQAFGDMILETVRDFGAFIYEYAEEIIATGIAIGGIIGITYIIVGLAPVLPLALVI